MIKLPLMIKDMRRSEWDKVFGDEVIIEPFMRDDIKGKISLLKITKINKPYTIPFNGKEVILANVGYYWLQLAYENDYKWYTVMFDDKDNLLQIYIDITGGNETNKDNPTFKDMYLDYVVAEDGIYELDRDEIDKAFQNRIITKEEYERSLDEGQKLYRYLIKHRKELQDFFIKEYLVLKEKLEKSK